MTVSASPEHSTVKLPSLRTLLIGTLFAFLWASASTAGKFGLRSAEPLFLFTARFLAAGLLMLGWVLAVKRERMPVTTEWKPLLVFGLFNTTLYLGIFIIALQYVTPGITSLAIALNPVLISIMSARMLGRTVKTSEWVSIAIGCSGVAMAVWPLLQSGHVQLTGVWMLLLCMVTYSYGSVYYRTIDWKLSRVAINAWQVFLGGLLLLPFAVIFHRGNNTFDLTFWLSEVWLVVPVSIVSVQLWLILLKADAVRASMWLFLCPIFGILVSAVLLDEPVSWMTGGGTTLVLLSLYLGQRN